MAMGKKSGLVEGRERRGRAPRTRPRNGPGRRTERGILQSPAGQGLARGRWKKGGRKRTWKRGLTTEAVEEGTDEGGS
jgi:hypothetical protein